MRNSKIQIIIIFFFILNISCHSDNKKLEYALTSSKHNRSELEKVLRHYENDTLKFAAAKFIIENMPGHYSSVGGLLNKQYDDIDSLLCLMTPYYSFEDSYRVKVIIDSILLESGVKKEIIQDIYMIKADYLIADIDRAFDSWENSPWSQHVEFDDFCEYLLPYKIAENYVLEDWRAIMNNHLKDDVLKLLTSFRYSSEMENSAFWSCKAINGYLKNKLKPDNSPNKSPNIYRLSTQVKIPYGTCNDNAIIAMAVMRSFGIPVMIDFTYQWPFRSLGHTWNIVLANNGKNYSFVGCDSDPDILHKPESKMAKVYRRTYSINQEYVNLKSEAKILPPALDNVFMKDVSDEYMKTYDAIIPIVWKQKYNYAYLAVFDNKNWIPICYGRRVGNSFKFEKVGNNILYLPVYYTSNGIKPFSDPFILDIKGNVKSIKLKSHITQKMILNRKFYISQLKHEYIKNIEGSIFQAANKIDFSDAITLDGIYKWSIKKDSINVSICKKYRFWRYFSNKKSVCNIAKLEFYDDNNFLLKNGDIIGSKDPCPPLNGKQSVFDQSVLSFYQPPFDVEYPWVGKDFKKPVIVSKIVYVPRNDDNNIKYGDLYELYYWNKFEWISLGKKIALSDNLIYDQAPIDAIFLLRNLTRGSEERIFTYENNKQIWW